MTVELLCHIFMLAFRTVTSPFCACTPSGGIRCPFRWQTCALGNRIPTPPSFTLPSTSHVVGVCLRSYCPTLLPVAYDVCCQSSALVCFTVRLYSGRRLYVASFSFAVICLFLFVFDAAPSSSTRRVLEALSRRPQLSGDWYA